MLLAMLPVSPSLFSMVGFILSRLSGYIPAFLNPEQMLVGIIAFSYASFTREGNLYFVIVAPGFLA